MTLVWMTLKITCAVVGISVLGCWAWYRLMGNNPKDYADEEVDSRPTWPPVEYPRIRQVTEHGYVVDCGARVRTSPTKRVH